MNVEARSESTDLLGLDRPGLEAFFTGLGEKPFRAVQVLQWIHRHGVVDFREMTNLSKVLRARLAEVATIRVPQIVQEQVSDDGTRKWLLQVDEQNRIETVYIPDEGRHTLCVSSQVGCALDCSFCSTAQQGFNRNLSAGEIIAQVWHAVRQLGEDCKLSNVVLMGMGEPLLNLRAVVSATAIMMDDHAYGLAKKRVTLSTAGVVPALQRLSTMSDVSLALSLHAPTDELRNHLVPINRKYPIRQVLDACRRYVDGDRRRVTIEYVMLDGVNDTSEHAHDLARLLCGFPAKVNLIPFNPFPGTRYRRSSDAAIETFRDILQAGNLITTLRRTRGEDIDAACGQLVGRVNDRSRRHLRRQHVALPAL